MTPAPVHLTPFDEAPGHNPSRTWPCGPIAIGRDLATAALAWRLRPPQKQRHRISETLQLRLHTLGWEWRP
jgi:hypothetical protein